MTDKQKYYMYYNMYRLTRQKHIRCFQREMDCRLLVLVSSCWNYSCFCSTCFLIICERKCIEYDFFFSFSLNPSYQDRQSKSSFKAFRSGNLKLRHSVKYAPSNFEKYQYFLNVEYCLLYICKRNDLNVQ